MPSPPQQPCWVDKGVFKSPRTPVICFKDLTLVAPQCLNRKQSSFIPRKILMYKCRTLMKNKELNKEADNRCQYKTIKYHMTMKKNTQYIAVIHSCSWTLQCGAGGDHLPCSWGVSIGKQADHLMSGLIILHEVAKLTWHHHVTTVTMPYISFTHTYIRSQHFYIEPLPNLDSTRTYQSMYRGWVSIYIYIYYKKNRHMSYVCIS